MKEMTMAFWRKTAAAALALTIVAGGAPAQLFPTVFSDTAITASAAAAPLPSSLSSGTLKLSSDLAAASNKTMEITGTVTIDLNGFSIVGHRNSDGSGVTVITVKTGGKLTITDSSSGKTGKITNGGTGGAIVVESGGSLLLESGSITKNAALAGDENKVAGGVYVAGEFTMTGGSIDNNSIGCSNYDIPQGGGVRVDAGGTFTMTGGTISNNKSAGNASNKSIGGGVCVSGGVFNFKGGTINENEAIQGAGVGITMGGTLNMIDADMNNRPTIKQNKSSTTDNPGAGICCLKGTANIKGGVITLNRNNSGSNYKPGAGVCIGGDSATVGGTTVPAAKVCIEGAPVIYGNVCAYNNKEVQTDLYLAKDQTITITGPLSTDAQIGISPAGNQLITSGWLTHMYGISPNVTNAYLFFNKVSATKRYFTLHNTGEVQASQSQAEQFTENVTIHNLTVDADPGVEYTIENGNGEAITSAVAGTLVYVNITNIDPNYEIDNVTYEYKNSAGTTVTGSTNSPQDYKYRFNMPDGDAKIRIKLKAKEVTAITFSGNTVSLDGDMGLNYYFKLPANKTGCKMRFTCFFDDEQKVVEVAPESTTIAGAAAYVFKCPVAAKDMTSNIKAELLDGNTVVWSKESYSVKAYALDYFKDPDCDGGKSVSLVKAMLNYGAYSQQYFNYKTDDLANNISYMTEADKTVSDLTKFGCTFKSDNTVSLPAGVSSGAILTLDDLISLKVVFPGAEKVEYAGDTGIDETVTVSTTKDGPAITFGGIRYWNLEKDFAIKVTKGGTSSVVKYSPKYFCHNVIELGQGKASLKPAMQALCKLYNTIRTYAAN